MCEEGAQGAKRNLIELCEVSREISKVEEEEIAQKLEVEVEG